MLGRAFALTYVFGALGGLLGGAPPVLDAMLPTGGKAGSEFEVLVSGKMDPWPCEVWCSHEGIKFSPDADKAGKYKAKIAGNVEPGAYLVRLANAEGASTPRIFVVGAFPEVTEDEAADHVSLTNPQNLPGGIPMVVNGRLSKGNEADFYRVSLKRGQRIFAKLDGHSLHSPIDPILHLYGPSGVRLAIGNDRPGGLDPEFDFEAPEDGDYAIAVMAFVHPPSSTVSFHGNVKAVYRLHLSESESPSKVETPNEKVAEKHSIPFEITRSVLEEVTSGRVEFVAKKSQKLLINVAAHSIGSPLDGVLVLEDGEGKLIKEIDDTKTSSDPEYFWTAPADGTYRVSVRDRFGRTGEKFAYRLSVAEAEPTYTSVVDKSEYVVAPEKSVEVNVTVTRLYGHTAKLVARVVDLPEGVTSDPVEVPEKGGAVKLKLNAGKGAKPTSGPLRVEVSEGADGDGSRSESAKFSFQTNTSQGSYLIDETEALWLTVKE